MTEINTDTLIILAIVGGVVSFSLGYLIGWKVAIDQARWQHHYILERMKRHDTQQKTT